MNPTQLAYPLRFGPGGFATVEQDTHADIEGCVEAALRTPLGWIDSQPDLGLPDLTGTPGGPGPDLIRVAADQGHPLADTLTSSEFDGLLARIRVTTEDPSGR